MGLVHDAGQVPSAVSLDPVGPCFVVVQSGAGGQSSWSMEPVNHEGWRVTVDQGEGRRGWLLLRQSLHDPLLVLNIESDQEGGMRLPAPETSNV